MNTKEGGGAGGNRAGLAVMQVLMPGPHVSKHLQGCHLADAAGVRGDHLLLHGHGVCAVPGKSLPPATLLRASRWQCSVLRTLSWGYVYPALWTSPHAPSPLTPPSTTASTCAAGDGAIGCAAVGGCAGPHQHPHSAAGQD